MTTKILAAVAAAGCAFALNADVSSANVVGYATREMNQGFSVNAPTFVDVASEDATIALENLKVRDGVGAQCEQIQVLGTDGRVTGETYYWLTEDDIGTEGWYDDMWDPITGIAVPKGAGFIFYCDSGAKLQTSGEVLAGETRIPLAAGFTVAGNNTNVDFDLQAFKIEDGVGAQCEQIQVLGTDGRVTGETYYWLTVDDIGTDGWYDDMWDPIEGVTLKAGQAHIFYADQGATLVIPSQL